MKKQKFFINLIIYPFFLILPILLIASVFHTCIQLNPHANACTSKIGTIRNGESSCLACRLERQGTPNQMIIIFDLGIPSCFALIHNKPYAFVPQAFLALHENRAPPFSA